MNYKIYARTPVVKSMAGPPRIGLPSRSFPAQTQVDGSPSFEAQLERAQRFGHSFSKVDGTGFDVSRGSRDSQNIIQMKRGKRQEKKIARAEAYQERMRQRLLDQSIGRRERERRELVMPTPTPAELTARRNALRRADHGVAHPGLPGIRVRRDSGQSPEGYTDNLVDTRASMSSLMSRPVGEQMLTQLEGKTASVNPGLAGDERNNPLTVVDIHSGRGLDSDSQMSHRPRHNDNDVQQAIADAQKAYRYDGRPGLGQASKINYDETAPKGNRFISLGHEMVHAWRAAHGVAVSPPEVSPQSGAAILNPPTQEIVKQVIGHHAHMKEEFETVGLQDTPRMAAAPTENKIRAEHGLPGRTDYSGVKPGDPGLNQMVKNVDNVTDNRNIRKKLRNLFKKDRPSPVVAMLRHLED